MCIVTSPGVEASDDHGPVRIQTTSSEGLWEPSWTCASKVPQRKQYFVFFKVCAGWSMLCNHMVILWVYLNVFVVCIYTYIHMYVYAVMCPYFVSNFICIAACWLLHVPFFSSCVNGTHQHLDLGVILKSTSCFTNHTIIVAIGFSSWAGWLVFAYIYIYWCANTCVQRIACIQRRFTFFDVGALATVASYAGSSQEREPLLPDDMRLDVSLETQVGNMIAAADKQAGDDEEDLIKAQNKVVGPSGLMKRKFNMKLMHHIFGGQDY